MLVSAWDSVTTKTVVNCFRKSKISSESQNAAITDDDNPFKDLEEEIENLRSVQPDLVLDTIDASSFTDVDADVAAVQPPLSDAEILMDLLDTEDGGNDDDDDGDNGVCDDEPVACPKYNDLLEMVEMMKQFSLFSKNGETVQSYANQLGRIVDEHFSAKKQSDIHDFFKKL